MWEDGESATPADLPFGITDALKAIKNRDAAIPAAKVVEPEPNEIRSADARLIDVPALAPVLSSIPKTEPHVPIEADEIVPPHSHHRFCAALDPETEQVPPVEREDETRKAKNHPRPSQWSFEADRDNKPAQSYSMALWQFKAKQPKFVARIHLVVAHDGFIQFKAVVSYPSLTADAGNFRQFRTLIEARDQIEKLVHEHEKL